MVGRSVDCQIVIDRPGISTQHASIRWTARGWILRDLQSRNGTLYNGARLVPPETRLLRAGDVLAFGERDEEWVIDDVGPPALVLLAGPDNGNDTVVIRVEDGPHALPSSDDPQGTFIPEGGMRWTFEDSEGGRRLVRDGETIDVGGVRWIVSVSPGDDETADAEHPILARTLGNASFAFRVSPDEETASARVTIAAAQIELRASASMYLLVFLARKRLDPDVPEGWVSTQLACDELSCTPEALNVSVHRARKALQAAGVVDAAGVVERKPRFLRLGLGTDRFTIA